MLGNLKLTAEQNNIPLEVIGMQNYGMMNGKAVLKQAEDLMHK